MVCMITNNANPNVTSKHSTALLVFEPFMWYTNAKKFQVEIPRNIAKRQKISIWDADGDKYEPSPPKVSQSGLLK